MKSHRFFAALYPHLSAPAERTWLGALRERLGSIEGRVLEIGAGNGANLAHYRAASQVVVSEPDPAMRARMGKKIAAANVSIDVRDAAAESLPFEDGAFDAVVSTLVLCSVDDAARAIAEARRVLRPGGALHFIEHARKAGARGVWQDRLQPIWSFFMGGCRPNRDLRAAIEAGGFAKVECEEHWPRRAPSIVKPIVAGTATR